MLLLTIGVSFTPGASSQKASTLTLSVKSVSYTHLLHTTAYWKDWDT